MRLPRSASAVLASLVVVSLVGTGLGPGPAGAAGDDPPPARDPVGRFGTTVLTETFRGTVRGAQQAVSADGRFVAFATATDTAIDANGRTDVYVRDRATGQTDLVSRDTAGKTSERGGYEPSISADGRYVAFLSTSPDLVAGDSGETLDVFVRDRTAGTTRRVNRDSTGAAVGVGPYVVRVSADGRSVVWTTIDGSYARIGTASTITTIDTDPVTEAFLSGDGRYVAYRGMSPDGIIRRRDLVSGEVVVLSVGPTGAQGPGYDISLSFDGSRAVFYSSDPDLVGPAGGEGIYVRDVDTGTTVKVAGYPVIAPMISGDGSTVSFSTWDALVPEDTDTQPGFVDSEIDVYTRPATGGAARLISADLPVAPRSAVPDSASAYWYGELSADGQVVSFPSSAVVAGSGTTTPTPQRWAVSGRPDQDASLPSLVTADFTPLYGRAPTTAERNTRVADLRSLRRTRPLSILDSLHDPAVAGTRAGVARLYEAYFLRPPDTGGYDYWVGQRQGGRSIHAVSQAFAASAEFRTLYGSLSNLQFVRLVYENVLGRLPDTAGETYWTAQPDSGAKTRGEVMTGFSEAPENRARTQNRVDAIIAHRAYRGTVPSRATLDGWGAQWRLGIPITSTLLGFRA